MSISNYSNEFKKLLNCKYFSNNLHQYRKDAFIEFEKVGFPNQKWEDWQFTNLSEISNGKFRISESKDVPPNNIDLNRYDIDGLNTIVIFNGHYQKHLSTIPDGVLILNGNEYLDKNNDSLELVNCSPFDLLNTAFVDSGIKIIIEKNTHIDIPIRILFIANGQDAIMINPRVCIEMEESSSLIFVEHHVGDAKSFFQNESLFISTKNNVKLDHIRIQSNSIHTQNISNISVKQADSSQYNFYQFSDGSQLSRLNMHISLDGQNAGCNVNSIAISKNRQHIDNNIVVNHNSPNTYSSQLVKTILFNKSTGVFNGKTVVNKKAQKIIAHQSNKNFRSQLI